MGDHSFLIHREALERATLEDISALMITHPYCALYRVIALMKARQSGHPDEKDRLEEAALFAPDRSRLFDLYRSGPDPASPVEYDIKRDRPAPMSRVFISREASENVRQTPLPKSSFPSWNTPKSRPQHPAPTAAMDTSPNSLSKKDDRELPATPETAPEKKATPPPKTLTELDAAFMAAKSVEENENIVSETLAKIFVRQGHKKRAIEIYRKLSLKFPEKKAYFAALIRELEA